LFQELSLGLEFMWSEAFWNVQTTLITAFLLWTLLRLRQLQ